MLHDFHSFNWKTLSYAEGWGVVYMVGLISIGIIGFLIDFFLTKFITDRRILKGIEITIAVGFSLLLLNELK